MLRLTLACVASRGGMDTARRLYAAQSVVLRIAGWLLVAFTAVEMITTRLAAQGQAEVTVLALNHQGTLYDFSISSTGGVCRVGSQEFRNLHKMTCPLGRQVKIALRLKIAAPHHREIDHTAWIVRNSQVLALALDTDISDRDPEPLPYPRKVRVPSGLCKDGAQFQWAEIRRANSDRVDASLAVSGCMITLGPQDVGRYSLLLRTGGQITAVTTFTVSYSRKNSVDIAAPPFVELP